MKLIVLIFTLSWLYLANGDSSSSTVLCRGQDCFESPALHTVSRSEFHDFLKNTLKSRMVLAFTKEKNVNESRIDCRSQRKGFFAENYHGGEHSTVYAHVENPLEVLLSLSSQDDYKSNLVKPIQCQPGNVIVLSPTNGNSDESGIIDKSDCPVTYLYVSPPLRQRVRRAAADNTTTNLFRASNQFLLAFSALQVVKNGQITPLDVTSMTLTSNTTNKLSFELMPAGVTFDIVYSLGTYNLSNVVYDGTSFLSYEVYAPTAFSYACGNLTLPATNSLYTTQLLWSSLQMQAPFNPATPSTFTFGNTWSCVGFVTPGIMMGFVIVALFLIIVFTGICWMVDIRTMDRFDDPKGKTITINAGE